MWSAPLNWTSQWSMRPHTLQSRILPCRAWIQLMRPAANCPRVLWADAHLEFIVQHRVMCQFSMKTIMMQNHENWIADGESWEESGSGVKGSLWSLTNATLYHELPVTLFFYWLLSSFLPSQWLWDYIIRMTIAFCDYLLIILQLELLVNLWFPRN